MSEVIVANSSAIIALQRKGRLTAFLRNKRVFITKRIYEELVEKPLKILKEIRDPMLREKISSAVFEIMSFIDKGILVIPEVDYGEISRVLDEARMRIAKLENLPPDRVKADHTVIGLAVYFARKGNPVIFLSNDKAINSVVRHFSERERLNIRIETVP